MISKYMKIAITGHTSGIGKSLYDFYGRNHQVLGFSRSNDYNIKQKSNEIIDQVKNCDVFVNNAHNNFSQLELLFKLWEQWHDEPKLIININSMICQVSWPYEYHHLVSKYKIHKLSLDKAVKELQQTPSKCQISQIEFGFVDTDFFLHEDQTLRKVFKNKTKLNMKAVIEIVNLIISEHQKLKINNLTVGEVY